MNTSGSLLAPPRSLAPLASLGALSPSSRPAALLAIVALHGLLVAGLLLWSPAYQLVSANTPLLVQLVMPAPPAPPALPTPPLLPKLPPPSAPELAQVPVPEVELAEPPPEPRITVAPAPPRPLAPPAAAAAAPAAPAPVAVLPPPPPAPVVLPPSAIQYLALPDVVYPSASRRLNETGLVVVAVWVGTDGLPQQVELAQSSGYERLDRAALEGVRRARFKPYLLNGRATAGWARIPIPFELTS